MAYTLSAPVCDALKYIYYDMRAGRAAEGLALLESSSAAGDGDASCILGRCLMGPRYAWKYHRFPTDEKRALELLRLSLHQGSALGVIALIRESELTAQLEREMKFPDLVSAFAAVIEAAEGGDAYCALMAGEAYAGHDFLRICGKDRSSFDSDESYNKYVAANEAKCDAFYRRAFRGGMYVAGDALIDRTDDENAFLTDKLPPKAVEILHEGAELGYPPHQLRYAEQLKASDTPADAVKWYRLAAEGGELDAWYKLGMCALKGECMVKDLKTAVSCFEHALDDDELEVRCCNQLGAIYYKGGDGMEPNYDLSYKYLKYAYDKGSRYGVYFLGKMCFFGTGTAQDYVAARKYLEQMDWHYWRKNYMLGCIYGQGLGVEVDCERAVEELKKAEHHHDAKEELAHYKKKLFGGWKRV